jgi:hypothetical protein
LIASTIMMFGRQPISTGKGDACSARTTDAH